MSTLLKLRYLWYRIMVYIDILFCNERNEISHKFIELRVISAFSFLIVISLIFQTQSTGHMLKALMRLLRRPGLFLKNNGMDELFSYLQIRQYMAILDRQIIQQVLLVLITKLARD